MRDTERVQVVDGGGDLMSNLLGSILGDLKVLLLEVREEVSSLEELHYDVDVV